MILLVHLLLGALIGQKISNPFLAIILAFLSHYFLDLFPHIEYPIKNIKQKQWHKAMPDILRVILDFCSGISLIFLFSKNNPIIYVCAFFAILPDGFTFLGYFLNNKTLKLHNDFHGGKIHFHKNKKISIFWRIFSQVAVAVICVILFKF